MEPVAVPDEARAPVKAAGIVVVIPTFNEAESIAAVVAEIPRDLVGRVIVADGGSSDGTVEEARRAGAKVPIDLLGLLRGKEVLLGTIDVASERVETPEEVAATIEQASRFVPVERLYPCTNCGMAPMDRSLAISKLVALSAGAALARGRFGSQHR